MPAKILLHRTGLGEGLRLKPLSEGDVEGGDPECSRDSTATERGQ